MRVRANVAAVTVVVAALAVPVLRSLGLGAHQTPALPGRHRRHDRVAFRVMCGTVWRIALNPVLGTQLRRTTARGLAALVTR